jgi:hypothetical protein
MKFRFQLGAENLKKMFVFLVPVLVLVTVGNVANGERHAEHVPLRVRMMEAEAGLQDVKVANERGRIYGGNYASIEQFPYVLSMHYVSFHICGASIISVGIGQATKC